MNLRIKNWEIELFGRCVVEFDFFPFPLPLTWNNLYYKIHSITLGDVVSLTDLNKGDK